MISLIICFANFKLQIESLFCKIKVAFRFALAKQSVKSYLSFYNQRFSHHRVIHIKKPLVKSGFLIIF